MKNLESFSFELPTRIEYDRGAIKTLGLYLKQLKASRVLLVTDKGLVKAGLADRVYSIIDKEVSAVEIFSDVEPNPKDYNVEEGARAGQNMKADCIVALGGGSPIDCAKGISVVMKGGGRIRDYEAPAPVPEGIPPLIAIPTTAGTGSEVTFGSVITDTTDNFKFTVKSPRIGPSVALADPELTVSMPPALTAATGMDALTHAVEGYTARNAQPIGDALGLYAIELIHANLRRAFNDGKDLEARGGMLLGSIIAGLCFSHSDVASVHCIAEALGGTYDLPHGVCNAVVLAPMMKYNMDYCVEKYARIARAMGFNYTTEAEGCSIAVEEVAKLARDVKLPSFRELGVREDQLELIAEKSARNGSNKNNPRPIDAKGYLEFLQDLYNEKM